MAVISKLDYNEKNTTKYNNEIIREFYHDGKTIEGLPEGIYNLAKEKEPKGLSKVICANAVPEPIIDMQVMGNSTQTGGQLFDKTKMLSGFLPLTGAYPTTNSSYPNATYQIIDIQAGQTVKVTYLGSNAEYGRIRYIDKDTNEVIGTIVGGVNTNNGYCMSTTYYNNRFYNGEITAIKDFKLGVMVTETLPSDFDLQILSLTNLIPTPETPIKIESVGERTINLLNKETSEDGKTINASGVVGDAGYGLTVTEPIYVKPNTGYTYSGMGDVLGTTVGRTGYMYKQDGTPIATLQSSSGASYYFETTEDCAYVRLIYKSDEEKPMLNEGALVSYEPYGYKVPVKVEGKNVYNPAWDSRFTLQEDGSYLSNINIRADVNILGNEKLPVSVYNVSVKLKSPVGMNYRPRVYYVDGTIKEVYKPSTGDYVDFSFTTEEKEIEQILWYYSANSNEVQYKDFQIEKSPMQTDYEPYFEPKTTDIYLAEPLRKVGYYADYIDYKNKKVVRNVAVLDDSGTQTIENSYQGLDTPIEETINIPEISTSRGTNYFEFDTEVSPSFAKINYWKQMGTDVVETEEIIQDGSTLLITSTGAELTKSGSTLTIGD